MFLKGLLIYCLIGIISAFLLLCVRIRPSKEEARKQFDEESKKIEDWSKETYSELTESMGSQIAPFAVSLLLFAFLWPIVIPRALIIKEEITKR